MLRAPVVIDEHDPELDTDEPTVDDAPDPEEFEPDGETATSGETGTVYEGEGEPAQTPHDDELSEDTTE